MALIHNGSMAKGTAIACPVCGGARLRTLFRVPVLLVERRIDECAGCGTAFLNPSLGPAERERLYSQAYFEEFYSTASRENLEAAGRGLLGRLGRFIPSSGRVLDIGAAWGCYLQAFRAAGWEAEGVEFSGYARAEAARTYGLRLHEDLFTAPLAAGSFDLVIMSQFLEHTEAPGAYLSRARELLKPDGVLYVSVPNFGSRRARALKEAWPALKPGEHLFFYSRKSLAFAAVRAGYEVLELQTPCPIVSRENCAAVVGAEGSRALSAFVDGYLGWLKRVIRRLAGTCFQGEGLELVARKRSR